MARNIHKHKSDTRKLELLTIELPMNKIYGNLNLTIKFILQFIKAWIGWENCVVMLYCNPEMKSKSHIYEQFFATNII